MADQISSQPVVDTADGNTGSAVPTVATQVGGSDGTNLRAISVDSSGKVNVNQGTANSVANSWPIKVTDGTDTGGVTTNGDQKVADGVRNGGVYGALNIPTANTAVEAKVGASRLTNRKSLIISIENNGVFWGLDNTVTTTSGVPTANGQVLTFSPDPDSTFQVWLVGSANNKNVHVVEIP